MQTLNRPQRLRLTRVFARCMPVRIAMVVLMVSAVYGGDPAPEHQPEESFELAAPVRVIGNVQATPGMAMDLQGDAYLRLQPARRVRLNQFPIEPKWSVDLELEQFTVTDSNTRIVMGTPTGDVAIARPQVALFRGHVVGFADSQVFLGISPSGSNGLIRFGGSVYVLAPDRAGPKADGSFPHVVQDLTVPVGKTPHHFECHTQTGPEPVAEVLDNEGSASGSYSIRIADVAIECDYEFGQSFDTINDAAVYVIELLGAVSSIYERELQVRLYLPYIRVWTTVSDPYTGSTVQDLLPEFEAYWRNNMGSVDRDLAHFLSTKDANGGLAEVDVLCDDTWGYGSSSGITGSFPVPLTDGLADNWDLFVVAHEMGHQFGSPHTHCYPPPIDMCWNTESGCYAGPAVCTQGTIMSYCKACPGNLVNMDLDFGTRVIQRIRQSVDSSCLASAFSSVFVDWAHVGTEIGTSTFPFNTVDEAIQVVIPGGTISISAGIYPENIVANRPMVFSPAGGSVIIGP